jgi:hypothetical protein
MEVSNAYWKYWEAVYGQFAVNAQGTLQVILPPNANVDFIKRSIVDNIDLVQISNVTVYADDCTSHTAKAFMGSFQLAVKDAGDLICLDDPMEFVLCAPDQKSEACISYMNSCIHRPAEGTAEDHVVPVASPEGEDGIIPPSTVSDQENWKQISDSTQVIQTKTRNPLAVVLLIIFLFVLTSCLLCISRRDPWAAWWERTSYNDKLPDTHSSDSHQSYCIRQEQFRPISRSH